MKQRADAYVYFTSISRHFWEIQEKGGRVDWGELYGIETFTYAKVSEGVENIGKGQHVHLQENALAKMCRITMFDTQSVVNHHFNLEVLMGWRRGATAYEKT